MSTVFEFTGVRALILDILARRKYFVPKLLDELGQGDGYVPAGG